jgi:hypothetical protein
LQLNEHNRTILTTRRQKYINISNISGTLSIQNTNINLSNKQIRKNKKKERRATFKGDFSFITISCGSGDFSISPPVVIMLSPLEVPSSSSELSTGRYERRE